MFELPIISGPIRPAMTVDGLRNLIQDLRRSPAGVPGAIIVSEADRRDINQDMLSCAATTVAKADQRPEHDGQCIAVVEGVPILSSPEVSRGKARLLYQQPKPAENRPGSGKIYVGA